MRANESARAMRTLRLLSSHALPGGKWNIPRGSKDKNVGCNIIAPIKLIIRRNGLRLPGIDCALRDLGSSTWALNCPPYLAQRIVKSVGVAVITLAEAEGLDQGIGRGEAP